MKTRLWKLVFVCTAFNCLTARSFPQVPSPSPTVTTATCGLAICTWNAFGPKTYTRPIEQPHEDGRHGEDGDDHSAVFTDSFTIQNIATQYKLHIVAEEGTRAEIVLNSRRIVDEDDFEEHRGDEEREGRAECHEGEKARCRSGSGNKEPEIVTIDKAIHPLATNVLQIRLHGKPGAQITASVIGVDTDSPSIVETLSPSPNSFGWNNTNVEVVFGCADATSGVATCPNPLLLTTEGLNQTATGTALDRAGNSASAKIQISIDKTPPIISASQSPAPNGAGWNNSSVMVSFACADALSGLASCPSPVAVSSEGANQSVSAVALDKAGNSASASVSVNIDKTAPIVSITSPANGSVVTASSLQLAGSASDNLSGIASVTCNGSPVVLTSGSFSCTVALASGSNSIQVQATDVAGNTSSIPLSVTFNPVNVVPPKAIFITPTLVNLLVGQGRTIKLVGDTGQSVSGATWAVSDPTVVGISAADPPQLTALSPGTTTLTAKFDGLNAAMTIKVFPGISLPFGTPLWSADSITGGGINFSVRANAVNPGDPDLYILDGPSTLRAFTADGEQLWLVNVVGGSPTGNAPSILSNHPAQASAEQNATSSKFTAFATSPIQAPTSTETLPDALQLQLAAQRRRTLQRMGQTTAGAQVDNPSDPVTQTAAITAPASTLVIETLSDNDGHAVNLVFNCLDIGCTGFNPSFISIDNASQTQLWSQDLTQAGPFISVSPFAVAPDNTIYAVGTYVLSRQPTSGVITKARTKIFALDGATGSQKFALELPAVSQEEILLDRDKNQIQDDVFEPGSVIGPISVMPDGSVQALLWTYHRMETQTESTGLSNSNCPGGQLACTTAISNHQKLELLTLQPGGSLSTQQMQTYDFEISGCMDCVDPGAATGFFPGQVIPDGFGGTLASWTKTSGTVLPFNKQPSQFLSSLGGPGGTFDIEMGTSFVPPFLEEGGSLVLGENNTVFAGSGPVLGAFDFTARTQRWASQSTGGQSFPVVATADGGLLAQKTSSRFGAIDSVLSFDPSGAATTFPTTTGISYFSDNTLQGFPNGTVALFLPPVPVATDPGNIWSPIAGNLYQQHAPTPPQVTFDKKVVKAGISLINKDVRGTVKATVSPKSAASQITFNSTNKARATVSEESRIDGTDSTTITLRITGVAATPVDKPTGDARIQALFAGNKIAERIPVLVVIPSTQEHAVGTTTLTNSSFQMTTRPFKFLLRTDVSNIVTLTIKDQFGNPLDSVYDGINVVTETLSNISPPNCASSIEQVIVLPDNILKAGIKLDETGSLLDFAPTSILTTQQQQDWANQQPVLGHKNSFALSGTTDACALTQRINVHGFAVTPDFQRNQEMLPKDQPPIPFTVTDTPVSH